MMIIARTACRTALGVLMALVFTFPPVTASAAPKAELWERWSAHDAASTLTIDHSAWDRFLKENLVHGGDGNNRLAYGRVTVADRKALARYLEALSMVPISRYNRDEQFAYWINLYNALTVQIVLQHNPVDSIRDIDISPGFFAREDTKTPVKVAAFAVVLNIALAASLMQVWASATVNSNLTGLLKNPRATTDIIPPMPHMDSAVKINMKVIKTLATLPANSRAASIPSSSSFRA